MLQLSPQLLAYLRSTQASAGSHGSTVAVSLARRESAPRKLNQARRNHLIDKTAKILNTGEASKFEFEASCRHGIRSSLCLQGWSWTDADLIATEIVAAALNRIGAERPTWAEGQPEYTQNGGGALIERTRCIRCHTQLPEGHYKFCSKLCGQSHREVLIRRQIMSEDRVIEAVVNPKRYSQWF